MLLNIFQENVPFFDCTVKEFIIGVIVIVVSVWVAAFVWGKIKAAFG